MRGIAVKSLMFLILGLLHVCCHAQTITAEHNYARNSPGIVMVQAVFSATVYVNRVEINERMFDKLVDSVKRLDTTGTLMSPGQSLHPCHYKQDCHCYHG